MEIGLYNAKYPFRKLINFLLSYFKHFNPNKISVGLLPIGFFTAVIYFFAPSLPLLYWVGIFLIFVRMVVGTLDGMVAENFNKETSNGAIINRLTPEAADMMLMLSIILANPDYLMLGLFTLLICWGISFTGLIGLAGRKRIQSIGPVGQTDRIVALMCFSAFQYFSVLHEWQFDFMKLFLWWVLLGGMLTIAIRCYKTLTQT